MQLGGGPKSSPGYFYRLFVFRYYYRVGGLPRGRVIEIYGPEASGKTTLALQAVAEAQKGGGQAAFIDAEHALDPTYASS